MLGPTALPASLRSRTRRLAGGPGAERPVPGDRGRFVLYWMRTAVRGHENPALEAALAAADALERPVFVYHALSERYPYASDRHHAFILEGARDVARELAARGVGHAFHLERPGHRGPHLRTLAARATLTVTEDLPVPFLARWTERLAATVETPVWAVDTACLVPMAESPADRVDRAYRFRKATASLRRRALEGGPGDAEVIRPGFVPELPFEPVPVGELTDREIADLVGRCEIDHGVPPVPHTRGGSRAGYARWRRFLEDGLKGYARRRNDPLAGGTSRMSPYLHYGMVSPFRIAREADRVEGKGADKYLDELLVWRELAHAFCWHRGAEVETPAALPTWARETLVAHRADPRPARYSWDTLARAGTGDVLWDACQTDLLRHGELHNNVRMTWGKALLGWTPGPDDALEAAVDLNHRYALDGRDPSSYGGILWCFGAFDRPFPPERDVLGTVRPRSTDWHAGRIDLEAYRQRVGRPLVPSPPRVAVVGAGIAGLSCARTLADAGLEAVLFDKGRGVGGRAATRRYDHGRYDHGAQYFTARDPVMRRHVRAWAREGVVERWTGPFVRVSPDGVEEDTLPEPRWRGVQGMRAVAERMARGLRVRTGTRVTGLVRGTDGWRLEREGEEPAGPFGRVVVTAPLPQAAALLREPAPDLAEAASAGRYDPCWAVMVRLPQAQASFEAARIDDGGPLTWAARSGPDWVLHGAHGWSREHLDHDPEEVARALLLALAALPGVSGVSGGDADPLERAAFLRVHRWRYARVAEAPGTDAPGGVLPDATGTLLLAGDGLRGSRIEDAFLAGRAAAGALLRPLVVGARAAGRTGHPDAPAPRTLDLFEAPAG